MKKLNILFDIMTVGCFFVAEYCWAGDVSLYNVNDLIFQDRNGLELVFDRENKPFSGAVIMPDENGRELTYFYKNGQKNGVAYSRFANEKLEFEVVYVDGKKNGDEVLFREDGSTVYKKTYKDNVLNGEELIFYENGKPQKKLHYFNGVIDGEVNYFDENGNLVQVETYVKGIKNGSEKVIVNGILREDNNYVNGKLNGISKKYSEKYLTDEITYKDGKKNGSHIIYNEDGSQIVANYVNGVKSGEYVVYDASKNIILHENYINDKKNGLSETYTSEQKMLSSEYYKNGKKEGISRYFDEGQHLQNVQYYVDNVQMSEIKIAENMILDSIYKKYLSQNLSNYTDNKNFWYQVLWLGLNLTSDSILQELDASMKMYGGQIAETNMYKEPNQFKYEKNNRTLFLGMTPLTYAVNMGASKDILEKLAVNSEIIEEFDERGSTALQEAVRLNNLDIVEFLLQKGADARRIYAQKNTIILYSLKENVQPKIVEALIEAKADVNAQNEDGDTPLRLAVMGHNSDMVKMLLEHQANVDDNNKSGIPLLFLAPKQQEIVELLLNAGADPNEVDANGNLLLLNALKNNDNDMALLLIEHGADVNKVDSYKENAVSYILGNSVDAKVFNAVWEKADIRDNIAKFGMPLWKYLLENNRYDLLASVFVKMDEVTKADINDEVPLYAVFDKNDERLTDLVLSYVDNADTTMVQYALTHKNKELLAKLLNKYEIAKFAEDNGDTLLLYLIKNGYDITYIGLLDKDKMAINALDDGGHSALYYAVKNDDVAAIEYLLMNGADVGTEDYLAELKFNQEKAARLLLSYYKYLQIQKTPTEILKLGLNNLNKVLVEEAWQHSGEIQPFDEEGMPWNHYLVPAIQGYSYEDSENLLVVIEKIERIFIERGYDINARDSNGQTLLIKFAITLDNDDLFNRIKDLLSDLGADTSIKDQYGRTADDYRSAK